MNETRIQKYLSDCGICSRRSAEKAILDGDVKVNGENAQIGMKIDPVKDKVYYKGRAVIKKRNKHYVYIMLNKPEGYVTTLSDEKGRKTVAELVRGVGERVYPVGRLDMYSEGLLIMTNDGELTNRLTHPKHSIPKVYLVNVLGKVEKDKLEQLSSPMEIDGYAIEPVECSVERYNESTTTLRMTLYEGRNRQIRKMCEKTELTVKRLKRVSVGKLELDVDKGKWRYLTKEEIDYLKKA